ncbi:MAG TPA: hypothetical protein VK348_05255, partial [Planctomycetota bacterium]|nr:hypothetical protein [Planctomycetota bacterium]
RFDAATAFVVFDDHRRADWTPYVYRTDDFGRTWTSLRTPAIDGYCLTILQDPVQKDLLFLGTEFGLWLSFDGGQQWQKWKHGLPTASVMAMAIQPEAHDLVVATHGRSMFVLDDLAPLRTLTPELLQQPLHLFAIPDAVQFITAQTPGSRFPGTGEYRGEAVPRGAMLTLITNADELAHADAEQDKPRKAARAAKAAAEAEAKAAAAKADPAQAPKSPSKEPPKDQVTVEVRAADGTPVRTFREGVKLGLNRICWRFDTDGVPGPARELQEDPELPPGNGGEAVPGAYTVTVKFQGQERSEKLALLPDPRTPFDLAAARSKAAARSTVQAIHRDLHAATQRLARSKRDVELCRQRLALEPKPKDGTADPHQATRSALDQCQKAIDELETRLYGPQGKQGIVRAQGLLNATRENLDITAGWDPPNATERLGLERARQQTDELVAAVNTFVAGPLAEFNTAFASSGLGLLPKATPVELGK